MSTTLQAEPIGKINWRCNGGINPLIRSYAELAATAGGELAAALRSIRIHCECHQRFGGRELTATMSDKQVADHYFATLRRPSWQDYQQHAPGICTPAQYLAKHGNTECRAKCCNLADLLQCFRLVGSYNEFDQPRADAMFRGFNRARYYNENNCNNGGDLFDYHFGWEGSHVVYVQFMHYRSAYTLESDWRSFRPYAPSNFVHDCEALAEFIHADESSAVEQSDNSTEWRFWWD